MLNCRNSRLTIITSLVLGGLTAAVGLIPKAQSDPPVKSHQDLVQLQNFADESGAFSTFSDTGAVDLHNGFFQSLGTNGRACVDCHQPKQGWSITPESVKGVFEATLGLDPLFRTNDGSNSPDVDVSTVGKRRRAYSMLLSKGLIRVEMPIPPTAEFTLTAVDDPYHYAGAAGLSLFRRPLPSTNLRFLTAVMWDGRESSLASQAQNAVIGHAQGGALDGKLIDSIVAFETSLSTAQTYDKDAGWLDVTGAGGGPLNLSQQEFHIGINDTLGQDPDGSPFNPNAFTLYQAWEDSSPHNHGRAAARAAVARGEKIFNTKPILISGVGGLNDALQTPVIRGTCTTCHNSPNVGDHSVKLPLNIGLTDVSRRTPDMPLYTLENKSTHQTVQTTDPGRALLSGKWDDIGKFKGPILRGLSARAPYFHNGSAASLDDVVDFYDTRFGIGFTRQEKSDLVAFLRTL